MGSFVLVAIFVVAVIGVFAYGFYASHQRQKALAAFAQELRLTYAPDAGGVEHKLEGLGFSPFGRGSSRRSSNLVRGLLDGLEWVMFDYRFTTGSGKNRRTLHYGIVSARIPIVLPELQIRPEGFFD